MEVTTYSAAQEFLAHSQEMLERREAVNNVLLGIANILIKTPNRIRDYYLVTVGDPAGVYVAGVMAAPRNLNLYAETLNPEAMSAVARHLYDQNISLPGVGGVAQTAHSFATVWTGLVGGSWSVTTHERIYELRQVVPPSGVPGKLVLVGRQDRQIVAAWLEAFYAEALPGTVLDSDFESMTDERIADENLFLWVVDGEPMSMAGGPTRLTRHGGTVGQVYTPPDKRGHGYASAIVAEVSQMILDSGKQFCALFASVANPTASGIYQKLGYVPLEDYDEVAFTG